MTTHQYIVWLKIACVTTLVIGLVAAFAASEATDDLWLWLFDLLDYPVDDNPSGFTAESFALNAVTGGVLVGWATLMYLIAAREFATGKFRLAGPMIASIVAWFIVDSIGSLVAGLPGNVILNVLFLGIFLPPLLMLRRSDQVSHS